MIGRTLSHYKVLKKIGEGGMVAVCHSLDMKLDRQPIFAKRKRP
jgi:hypothetical protein